MKNFFRLFYCGRLLFIVFCLFTATNPLHAQWINGPDLGRIRCFVVNGTNLYAGSDFPGGVFLSTNNGTNWSDVSTGLAYTYVHALAISGTNLFAGTNYGGVFLSTNNGTSWTQASTGLPTIDVLALTISGTNLFAGTVYDGVFLSTNSGTSWSAVNTGLPQDLTVYVLSVSPPKGGGGTSLFAGTDSGIFLSTDNGISWTAASTGLMNNSVLALAVSGTNLFAGTYLGGVFLSTNNGTSWSAVNTGLPPDPTVYAFAVSGTNIFAGTNIGGAFLSTNNGTSWIAVNAGLTSNDVMALAVSGTNLFAGHNGSVWRRPLSEMITSVLAEGRSTDWPTHFSLDQNYPNPFNPATTIRYSLPSSSRVKLAVYNVLGQLVSELVNEEQTAGWKEVQWNAKDVPSGVYFCRLQAGSFLETKRLLLLK